MAGLPLLLSLVNYSANLYLVTSFLGDLLSQLPFCTLSLSHDFDSVPPPLSNILMGKIIKVAKGQSYESPKDLCSLHVVTSANGTLVKSLVPKRISSQHLMVIWVRDEDPLYDLSGIFLDQVKFKLTLVYDNEKLQMHTYCIFCSPMQMVSLGSYSEGDHINLPALFPDMTCDLRQKNLKALSVFFSVRREQLAAHEKGLPTSEKNIFGTDMMYLYMAQSLNFNFEAKEPQLGMVRNGSFVYNLVNGTVDIILHSFMTPKLWALMDYTYPFVFDFGTFATARPLTSHNWVSMSTPYSLKVWLLFSLALIVSVVAISALMYSSRIIKGASRAWKRHSQASVWEWSMRYVIRVLLEQPIPTPTDRPTRVFLASWWLAALVILTSYKSRLFGELSIPVRQWHPKTFAQLNESNFSFGSSERIVAHAASVFDRTSFTSLYDLFLDRGIFQNSTSACVQAALSSPSFACIDSHKVLLDKASRLVDQKGHSLLWVSSDQILYHYVGIAVKKGWVAKESMNRVLGRATNAGLPIKFQRLRSYRHSLLGAHTHSDCQECEDKNPEALSIAKLVGPFYFWGFGLAIGIVFFLAEILRTRSANE